jgi:hypothetical protein
MIAYLVLAAAIGALVALGVARFIPCAKPTPLMPEQQYANWTALGANSDNDTALDALDKQFIETALKNYRDDGFVTLP